MRNTEVKAKQSLLSVFGQWRISLGQCLRRFANWFHNVRLIQLFQVFGSLFLLATIGLFYSEARKKEEPEALTWQQREELMQKSAADDPIGKAQFNSVHFIEYLYSHKKDNDALRKHIENRSMEDLNQIQLPKISLKNINLSRKYLYVANLSNAQLQNSNLSNARLQSANLSGANLRSVNLSDSSTWKTNFSSADLRKANLSGTYAWKTNFSGADLRKANLSGVNLKKSDLSGANLKHADLTNAMLQEAVFSNKKHGMVKHLSQTQIDQTFAIQLVGNIAIAKPNAIKLRQLPFTIHKDRVCLYNKRNTSKWSRMPRNILKSCEKQAHFRTIKEPKKHPL